jgi:hypothetical protein
MRDEIKQAILSKNSFLIYGYDQGYNIDIFNELTEGLEARHNEIFYFDMVSYGVKPNFKKELNRVPQQYNLFEFFKEKEISKIHFDRYIQDICDCLHAELFDTKVDGQIYLKHLLEAVYQSDDSTAFDMDEFMKLLGNIINASKSRIDNKFFKKLDQLDSLKSKYPDDYFTDSDFDKLAKDIRLLLEQYIFEDPSKRNYSDVVLKWSNYDLGVKYFTKLLERMNIPLLKKFSNEPKTVPGKINHFQIDHYTMRCNYLGMVLSSIVRKLKIYDSSNKPLIIINGKQKDLFKSVSMDIEELFHHCRVCFIISSIEELDARVNFFVDVKICSDKHKNLSLQDTFMEKRIENNYSVYYD